MRDFKPIVKVSQTRRTGFLIREENRVHGFSVLRLARTHFSLVASNVYLLRTIHRVSAMKSYILI